MAWTNITLVVVAVILAINKVNSSLLNVEVVKDIVHEVKVVQTNLGPVDGIEEIGKTDKKVIAYLGIPYAEPPVGELRFRPPIPPQPFTDVYKATKPSLACYQHGPDRMLRLLKKYGYFLKRPWSEDCLTLNIYVPVDSPEKASVIVYIHAGAFYAGSSTSYFMKGATLASEENVIVVTMNYRLGVFGFLSLNHEEAPGNVGLMDQQLALKYVHDNIAAFGGNPQDVTLAGTSAGSASVGFQILSPGSRGLFQKVIMQSGVPISAWSYGSIETVVKKSYEVATNLGYHGKNDPSSLAKFLRSLQPDDIMEGNIMIDVASEVNMILPTVDGNFLTKDPDHAIVDAAAETNITIMIGTTSDEGALFAFMSHPELFFRYEDNSINFNEYEQVIRNFGFGDDEAEAIVNNYVQNQHRGNPHYLRKLATETVGDYLISCDVAEYADYFSDRGFKVYRYIFDAKFPFNIAGFPSWTGTVHGNDVPVFFGQSLVTQIELSSLNDSQREYVDFARQTLHRYGAFARTGNPNSEETKVQWPLYTTETGDTLVLSLKEDHLVHHPRAKECSIWRNIVPLVETFGDCKRSHKHTPPRIKH